jgi:arginine decarboxylase-like protein
VPASKYLDVGGGLGVDYDGSQTNFESSVNYSLQEYANDVVYHVQNACDEAGVPHPTIISESGRAVVAYHSMLIFGVLGVSEQGGNGELVEPPARRPSSRCTTSSRVPRTSTSATCWRAITTPSSHSTRP